MISVYSSTNAWKQEKICLSDGTHLPTFIDPEKLTWTKNWSCKYYVLVIKSSESSFLDKNTFKKRGRSRLSILSNRVWSQSIHLWTGEFLTKNLALYWIWSTYKFLKDWDVRLMIERSKAIKCPTIQMHLTGCKVVQSIMAQPGIVEKYVESQEAATRIRNTFVDIYDINVSFHLGHFLLRFSLQHVLFENQG